MLRLKAAASAKEDFTEAQLQPVIGDTSVDPTKVKSILLCSGKVTWDLMAARAKQERDDVAIVRCERLYPLPAEEILEILGGFPADSTLTWVQEEPENQGAWPYMLLNLVPHLDRVLSAVSRPASASPAVGLHSVFEREQAEIVERAFAQ
jgi:2-oxoglutarate dehydrogenase E1 component